MVAVDQYDDCGPHSAIRPRGSTTCIKYCEQKGIAQVDRRSIKRENLRIHNKDSRCLGQVECHTSRFQGDQEHLNIGILHEMLDGLLALRWRHGSIKHDRVEACMAQAPLHKLEHRGELRENDRLWRMALGSLQIELIQKGLDLGGGRPVIHQNAIDDRILLDRFSRLFNRWLLQINRKRNMALGAVDHRGVIKRLNVVLGTLTAKLMTTARPNRILRRLITNAADQDIKSGLHVFLQDEIRVVGYLSHLHNQSENVGIVVEHHTSANVGVELARRVGHDTAGEIMFDLAEELVMDGDAVEGNVRLASTDHTG